uniref:Uncharacterized protein n=1 Tax=Arundo donax TaxID=35708 RepID=A0A0A9HV92_ARUDO
MQTDKQEGKGCCTGDAETIENRMLTTMCLYSSLI